MSEQKKKDAAETAKVESPKLPNVAYPLKSRNGTTNLSQQYFNHLAGDESARFLFNNSGLWHQGIHLRASKFKASEFENDKICAIADGKLIAYKVDSEYKKDSEADEPMQSAVYSTGYFLLKHEMAYPKDNVLTFYSLYRHTAKLGDYKSSGEEILGLTKSADKFPVAIREDNKVIAQLPDGLTLLVRKYQGNKIKFDEVVWFKDANGVEHKPKAGKHWKVFSGSYETMMSQPISGIPLLTRHNVETQADSEVKLDKPIDIKAGEELGLMGEYNQMGENGEKLLHLEVFTYDNIEQFKAKAEAAYKQDKEKKGIKDNFLYVARDSQLYTIVKDDVVELEKTKVEIMVPLTDVQKVSLKDNQNPKKTKDYYNVQPYLYQQVQGNKDGGIYVDESHLTHGVLFPGVNVFTQAGNGLCIFKHALHENIDPKSDLTIEQKNELDPMFKSIMDELDLDKDKNTSAVFEAGKLKDLLLSPIQQRRLTGIVGKHDSEWKKTRVADFRQTCGVYRNNNKEDSAARIEKRVEDLSIKLEVDGFNTDKQAYYMHPLGVIGWLAVKTGKLIDRDYFFEQYKKHFITLTNSEKNALENIFTGIEEYCENDKSYVCSLKKIAYMLATAKHETGHTFEPITEKGSMSYFNKYDPILANTPERRKRAIDMENTQKGDGYKYRGRGYVQLTWKKNYRKSGEYLKQDLVNNPELALDQKNATKIMIYGMETGMFTAKKISSYISEDSADYLNARRVINGMDKAATIAGYASKLEECLRWL